MRQATISKGGQVSIPAEVRHRWGTNRVLVDDRGSELVFRPIPEDPIGAARGALRANGGDEPTTADARQQTRQEERETAATPRATR
ncbi:MAG: AbrB/MazE/SpoVT family DNA-binding domain-containing protein [Chloroflexi bacterium]|nr:AbrB/MazE/SpoVT family DNA-binding domain-containing protein [Chloroflexota bacterium]